MMEDIAGHVEVPAVVAVVIFFVGMAVGWIGRMRFDYEARRDEQAIDDALARQWQAGWRAARNERLTK